MQVRLGIDLGRVRAHTGAEAARAADAVDAVAFTTGDHIVLGDTAGRPGTADGDALLAHELGHVAQQRMARQIFPGVSTPGDAAENAALSFASGGSAPISASPVPAVQRQEKPGTPGTPPASSGSQTGIGTGYLGKERAFLSQADAEVALTSFLERAVKESGASTLKISPRAETVLMKLAAGDSTTSLKLTNVLADLKAHPVSVKQAAHRIAGALPNSMPVGRLDALSGTSTQSSVDPRPASVGQAAGALAEKEITPLVRKLPIPKDQQDKLIKAAKDSATDLLMSALDTALAGAGVVGAAAAGIRAVVEGIVKKEGARMMDRQDDGAGSPYRREPAPSVAPSAPSPGGVIQSPSIPLPF
jgi:hypothetical protein